MSDKMKLTDYAGTEFLQKKEFTILIPGNDDRSSGGILLSTNANTKSHSSYNRTGAAL